MGLRGPSPTPTRLKLIRGNPGKRKLNDAEPQPRECAPEMPRWLTGEAAAEWKRLVPELESLRLLTIVDRAALAAYCQAWEEFVECTKTLKAEGRICKEPIILTTLETVDGVEVKKQVAAERLRAHPAVRLQRDAFARVKVYLAEFGLSPASRSRVKTPAAKEAVDPADEILGRRTR